MNTRHSECVQSIVCSPSHVGLSRSWDFVHGREKYPIPRTLEGNLSIENEEISC